MAVCHGAAGDGMDIAGLVTMVKTMYKVAATEAAGSVRPTPAAQGLCLAGVHAYAITAYPTASLVETPRHLWTVKQGMERPGKTEGDDDGQERGSR